MESHLYVGGQRGRMETLPLSPASERMLLQWGSLMPRPGTEASPNEFVAFFCNMMLFMRALFTLCEWQSSCKTLPPYTTSSGVSTEPSAPMCSRKKVNFGGAPPDRRSSLSRTSARGVPSPSGAGAPSDVFSDNGRLKIPTTELIAIISSDQFVSSEFVASYMGQLSTTGFEAARQELEKVINQVQNQVRFHLCSVAGCTVCSSTMVHR